MLRFVHRPVPEVICLPFCAGQVAYSWFLELFHRKKLPDAAKITLMGAVELCNTFLCLHILVSFPMLKPDLLPADLFPSNKLLDWFKLTCSYIVCLIYLHKPKPSKVIPRRINQYKPQPTNQSEDAYVPHCLPVCVYVRVHLPVCVCVSGVYQIQPWLRVLMLSFLRMWDGGLPA